MFFIALMELLPGALKFGSYRLAGASACAGMVVMAGSIVMLTQWRPDN